MIPLKLVMTTAGLGRFAAAQSDDDVDLTVTQVGLSNVPFVAAPSLTGLPGEFRRLATVSGDAVGDNIVHMTVQDEEALSYTVHGFGLWLGDGTLFATYSQPDVIAEKASGAMLLLAIDIAFPEAGVENITFGDTSFLNPPATTETKGVVELATDDEADAGTPGLLAITARQLHRAMLALQQAIDDLTGNVGAALAAFGQRRIEGEGLITGGGDLTANRTLKVTAATKEQLLAHTAGDVSVTPQSFDGTAHLAQDGWIRHPSGLIEQWGVWTGSMSAEASFVVPFGFAFPTACLGMHAIVRNPTASNEGVVVAQEVSLSTTSATLFAQNEAGTSSNTTGVRWRAWGY